MLTGLYITGGSSSIGKDVNQKDSQRGRIRCHLGRGNTDQGHIRL